MIVPMSHITLLCLDSDKPKALEQLAGLGVLHIVAKVTETETILLAKRAEEEAQRAVVVVAAAAAGDPMQLSFKPGAPTDDGDHSLVAEINRLADRYVELQKAAAELSQEIARYAPWGDFDPDQAEALSRSGILVTLFKAPLSVEVPALADGMLEIISSDKTGVYGVVAGAELPAGLTTVRMPKMRLSTLQEEGRRLDAKLLDHATKLASYAADVEALEAERARREADGEYVTAFDNMPISGTIAHIAGFIDSRQVAAVIETAQVTGWGVAVRDPKPDEWPPTLLEPPRFFRPVVALFQALGITPGYRETDVSVPFFIFFSIFFSMLIGDAGYGALILLFTAIGCAKARKRAGGILSASARSMVILFTVFGFCTIAYGVLSGTYFGIEKDLLPAFLKFGSVTFLQDNNNVMQLCFTLGAVHLSLARLWNAIVLFPSKKFLSEVGWIGVVWSMYLVICGIVISGFDYPSWGTPMMFGSILLVVLFMIDYSRLKEEGVELGMLPLAIINNMGDIISYVRLFAVGLASVTIAESFNMMAMDLDLPMLVKLPAVALILLLGHGLNLAMGALSIIVHAVRLNTLEFSGAKGVTWSGHPFKVFKATARESVSAVDQKS